MERISRLKLKTDIRYASPDGIRPNPELINRARENFNRKNTQRPPSPSQLPIPSQILLTRKKSRSKSPRVVVLQGKNRKWTITSKPRSNSVTRRKGKGTGRGKGKHRSKK